MKQELHLDHYVTPRRIGDRIHRVVFGGPLMGGRVGYQSGGDLVLPEKGGQVTLVFNEVTYKAMRSSDVEKTRPIYTMVCDFPEEAVLRYSRLNPKLKTWDAPINNFDIELPEINDVLEAKARELFEAMK